MYRALYFVREHLYDNKITYIHISNGFNNLYFSSMYTMFKEGCFDWHWCHRPFLLLFCISQFCILRNVSIFNNNVLLPNYSNSVEHTGIPFLNPLDIAKIKLWRINNTKKTKNFYIYKSFSRSFIIHNYEFSKPANWDVQCINHVSRHFHVCW